MSIFADDSLPESYFDKDAIRAQVSMPSLVTYLGLEWDRQRQKVKCVRHKAGQEKTPSAQVNEQTLYCHVCTQTWDIFQLVMESQHVSFGKSIGWLAEHVADIPKAAVKEAKTGADYLGPANRDLVEHWRSNLQEGHRLYLRNERLLTDETIDFSGIGWRSEWSAYSLPFWRGTPFQSEVDIVQFRATEATPWFNNGERRYLGLTGHNRPSIIGRHRIGYNAVVLFFGTFDALLATQDGLSAVSINGASTFLRDEEAIGRLSGCLRASHIYLVPDRTTSEYPAAYRLAGLLERRGKQVSVCHFPPDSLGKDYTEYRQNGGTALAFRQEILGLKSAFPSDNGDLPKIVEMIKNLSEGKIDPVLAQLKSLAETNYMPQVVCHELQLQVSFSPHSGLTHEQWDQMLAQLESSLSWEKLATVLTYWTKIAEQNQGAF